ncbi:hypothetical protein EYF80_030678 [Liparis tanakae]|uniref:Uncharacterized protein n=1 Tax=Liparis tanakae TaxID=230148 RepID=A0A4Z2H2V1_9TELE|nr:hypothetical protein EYF80_030678 [Liparis tanakae]
MSLLLNTLAHRAFRRPAYIGGVNPSVRASASPREVTGKRRERGLRSRRKRADLQIATAIRYTHRCFRRHAEPHSVRGGSLVSFCRRGRREDRVRPESAAPMFEGESLRHLGHALQKQKTTNRRSTKNTSTEALRGSSCAPLDASLDFVRAHVSSSSDAFGAALCLAAVGGERGIGIARLMRRREYSPVIVSRDHRADVRNASRSNKQQPPPNRVRMKGTLPKERAPPPDRRNHTRVEVMSEGTDCITFT